MYTRYLYLLPNEKLIVNATFINYKYNFFIIFKFKRLQFQKLFSNFSVFNCIKNQNRGKKFVFIVVFKLWSHFSLRTEIFVYTEHNLGKARLMYLQK